MKRKSNTITKKQSAVCAQAMTSVKKRNKAQEELESGKWTILEGGWGVKAFLRRS